MRKLNARGEPHNPLPRSKAIGHKCLECRKVFQRGDSETQER